MTLPQLIRSKEVLERIHVSRSTLEKWVRLGAFPKPVKMGAWAKGWREADVVAWLAGREGK